MLHLTSFFQNASKLNSPSNKISNLNKLSKNYSFVYNQKLDRYDFLYNNDDEDYERGYFGCFRDQNADRKLLATNNNDLNIVSTATSTSPTNLSKQAEYETDNTNYDGYWGLFKDTHLSINETIYLNKSSSANTTKTFNQIRLEEPIFYFEPTETPENDTLSNDDSQMKPNDTTNPSTCSAKKIVYDYKRSKFKIEAGKRDQMKVLMQNLEDREMQLKKEIIKKFDFTCDSNSHNLVVAEANNEEEDFHFSSSFELSSLSRSRVKKLKRINFLHFSNKTNSSSLNELDLVNKTRSLLFSSTSDSFAQFLKSNLKNSFLTQQTTANLNNFKNAFNVLSKLNKSINIFNGNYLNLDEKGSYLDQFLSFFNNVNASQFDLSGLLFNLNKNFNKETSSTTPTTATISLCSNIYDKSQKPFGYSNHSTMLFEHNGVKIGFMALVDQTFFNRLKMYIENDDQIMIQSEYVDFVLEANRLSRQLRLSGAHLCVALINFDCDQNEERLLHEATDLDLIFSSHGHSEHSEVQKESINHDVKVLNDVRFKQFNNKWLIKSPNNFDTISLVSLNLDELNSNKIVDLAITKYFV